MTTFRKGDIVTYQFTVQEVYPEIKAVSDGRAMFTNDSIILKRRNYKPGDQVKHGIKFGTILAVHPSSELAWVEFKDQQGPSVVAFDNLNVV